MTVVRDPLVIDECRLEIEQALQHLHVVRLAFDDVGKVEIGPIGLEQLGGDLLDRKDHGRVGNFGDNRRPRIPVLLILEGPDVGGLDHDLDAVGHQARHLLG